MYHCDVNAENKLVYTALMEVSWERHLELIKKLLNHHAEVDSQDECGFTPLMVCGYKENYEILKELLKHHNDVNIQLFNHNLMVYSSSTASIEVSKNKFTQIVMELINHNT